MVFPLSPDHSLPTPPSLPSSRTRTFPPPVIISWNINGLSPSPATSLKLQFLRRIIRSLDASFILLQETHVSDSLIPFSLLSSFPSFSWFSLPSAIPGRQGIAIGVQTSALLPFSPVNFHPSPDLSSLAISAHLPLHGRISIASSSSHPSPSPFFLSPLTSFLRSLPQPLFWVGDLNVSTSSPLIEG